MLSKLVGLTWILWELCKLILLIWLKRSGLRIISRLHIDGYDGCGCRFGYGDTERQDFEFLGEGTCIIHDTYGVLGMERVWVRELGGVFMLHRL